jgi:fatty-acyl-CoA synthase
MRGYWQEPERSAEALRGGWMHTGDLAVLDAEGGCRIVGRVRDLVLRGEHSVFPQEVEAAFSRHPKVAAVQVFGVPDAELGEELCAWVVPRPGSACSLAELRRFCRERLAPPQVPRHIRVVDRLPVTVNGKPRKFVMRDAMMRELGMGLEGPLEGDRGSA